jgi:hypothetical protein
VIYRPSSGQVEYLQTDEAFEDDVGNLTYQLRYRDREELYYDGDRGLFVGEKLEDNEA